jgi:squalene synthase HpnC
MRADSVLTEPLPGAASGLLVAEEPARWEGNLPAVPASLADARRYCERLARTHYENFPVATLLLPARLRPHLYAVYAYCRWADDLGDETGGPPRALWLLDRWEDELQACYAGRARHPVFVALADTVARLDIPAQPFHDLITAFRRDQATTRYQSFEDVLGYCRYSANPVGRLVLYVCGYRDPERQQLSDYTCTALQLANFWQDVRRDYDIGRIYIPLEDMAAAGYSEEELRGHRYNSNFARLLQTLVARTWLLFRKGLPLVERVDRRLAVDIELFSRGGMEILRLIERQNYDVLSRRPHLGKPQMMMLGASVLARQLSLSRRLV